MKDWIWKKNQIGQEKKPCTIQHTPPAFTGSSLLMQTQSQSEVILLVIQLGKTHIRMLVKALRHRRILLKTWEKPKTLLLRYFHEALQKSRQNIPSQHITLHREKIPGIQECSAMKAVPNMLGES